MFLEKKKIAVIGAGVAGLAVAARLASKGFQVSVFEKNPSAGGKMSEIRSGGYRFDTGPSLFTMPGWLEELFSDTGENLRDYLEYDKLDLLCRYFYEDGSTVNAYSDPAAFARELHDKAGENPENLTRYLKKSEKVFNITNPVFLQSSIHLFRNYFRGDFLKAYLSLPAIKPFEKFNHLNRLSFIDPRTIQIFDRFATYNGSSPYKTPATMTVIPHLEHNIGAFFPRGGIYRIASALEKLARKKGADFHFNSGVDRIITTNGRVKGLEAGGISHDYDLVVTDCDLFYVYDRLLGQKKLPRMWFSHDRSTSALIFYWGMNTTSPNLDIHNILFSANYPAEFDHLFRQKNIYEDPTVYIFISSKLIKGDAPAGKENWFVMINAPENTGQDWDRLIAEARASICEKIHRVTGCYPDKFIDFEQVMDPRGIENQTSSFRGSLYGNSSNNLWAAFRRHPNFMPGLRGLFLVGGSVHPGGGIPLCLSSAKIVSGLITNNTKT